MTVDKSWDSKTAFHHLGEMMSDGFLILDNEGKIKFTNMEFSLLVGKSPTEIEGELISRFLNPENNDKLQKLIVDIHESGQLSTEIVWETDTQDSIASLVVARSINEESHDIGLIVTDTPSISDLSSDDSSDQSFEDLLEMSPDGIAVVSRTGRVVYVNQVMVDQTGSSRDEVLGKRFTKLQALRARDIPRHLKTFSAAIRGKMPAPFEVYWNDREGNECCSEVRVSAVRKDGKFVGLMSIARDITNRKRIESELKKSHRFQDTILDTIRDGVIYMNMDMEIALCNKSIERILGFKSEDLVGKKYTAIIPDSLHNDPHQKARQSELFEQGYMHNEDFQFKRKDGSTVSAAYSVALIMDEEGQTQGMVGTIRDISRSKKVRAALVESEEKYRTLFETMSDGVVYQDKNGAIINANPAAEIILGLSYEKMMGRELTDSLWKIINSDGNELPREEHPALVALKTGQPIYDTVLGVYNPAAGEYRWIDVNAVPLFKSGESQPFQVYITFNDITLKKHDDEIIRESETKYRQLFSLAPVGIGLSYKNGQIIDMNRHLRDMLGVFPDELDLNVTDFYAYDEERQRILKDLRENGSVRNLEIRLKRKDGSIIWTLFNVDIVYFEGEQAIFTTMRDITNLKEASLALQESEANFRVLFENTPNSLALQEIIVDETGHPVDFKFIQVNDAFLSYSNLTPEDVIGKKVTEVFPGVEGAQKDWIQTMGSVALTGEIFRMDALMEQYGRWFKVLAFSPKKNQFVTVFTDIHDMKLTEASLREAKERAETYLDIAGVMFLILDAKGIVTMINRMGSEILGTSPELIVGRNWFDEFIPNSISEEMKKRYQQLIENRIDSVDTYINSVRSKTGEDRIIEWRNTQLRNEEGDIYGVLSSGADITEKMDAQKKIQTERDRAMLYLDLMSHDIRNKLQAIIGSAEIIRQVSESDVIDDLSEVVLTASERCGDIIAKIKKTERLTSVDLVKTNLNAVLVETIVEFNKSFPNVQISMNRTGPPVFVYADEFLDDMMYTLLENATTHNHREDKEIWVRLYDEGNGFAIVISDNGSGLPEYQKDVLFDMGKRIAGVGLHQVKQIVEKYKGYIQVSDRIDGKPTAGAEFRVWIPKANGSPSHDP